MVQENGYSVNIFTYFEFLIFCCNFGVHNGKMFHLPGTCGADIS